MAAQAKALYKTLKEYSGTISNSAIILGTTGVQQLTTLAVYRCPCVDPSVLGPGCEISSSGADRTPDCLQQLNYGYGLSYIIAPAIALYIFSIAASPNLWKSITGCIGKSAEFRRATTDASWTLLTIFSQGLISPITWVCIALIDGRYLACSLTILPYDVGPSRTYNTCNAVSSAEDVYVSDEFLNNRTFSQVVGAICISVLLCFGFAVFCVTQCTYPLTYYHAKYYQIYRQMEQSEFEDEMRKKAQQEAEENVQRFLKERRDKSLWDRISTVFQFHRDKKQLALYSQLYEWVLECRKEECRTSGTEEALLTHEDETKMAETVA